VHDTAYTKELLVANWDNGYRDLIATIDLSTYRRLKWEKNIPFFLCSFTIPETMEKLPVDPRGLLAKVLEEGTSSGIKAMAGAEFEVSNDLYQFLLIRPLSSGEAADHFPFPLILHSTSSSVNQLNHWPTRNSIISIL